MGYRDNTYGSRDALRRLSHTSRLDFAAELANVEPSSRILDYGGGDGEFLRRLGRATRGNGLSVNFEPYMETDSTEEIVLVRAWDDVAALASEQKFDLVSCQEVLEHFSEARQMEALKEIRSILAPSGRLLISVPIESGPVALVKNIGRWKYRKSDARTYTYANLTKSLFRVPIPEARSGDHYLNHMGFYYQDLEKILLQGDFLIIKKKFSPFHSLPGFINSQVFYVCSPR